MADHKNIKLGDRVFIAIARGRDKSKTITCPDCFGTGQLDVVLKNGETHSIECELCKVSYGGSLGFIRAWDYKPEVRVERIDAINAKLNEPYEYFAGGSYYEEDRIFLTQQEAEAKAAAMAEEQARKDEEALKRKERDTRSWAWNVMYHRREIRDAEEKIQYHKAKLSVAELKSKKEKGNP